MRKHSGSEDFRKGSRHSIPPSGSSASLTRAQRAGSNIDCSSSFSKTVEAEQTPLALFRSALVGSRCSELGSEAKPTRWQGMDYSNVSDIKQNQRIESIPSSFSPALQVRAFINPQRLPLFLRTPEPTRARWFVCLRDCSWVCCQTNSLLREKSNICCTINSSNVLLFSHNRGTI